MSEEIVTLQNVQYALDNVGSFDFGDFTVDDIQSLLDLYEKEKQLNFNGKNEDISMLLVSSARYALGRRTYIAKWTCEIIKKNMHLLSDKDKAVMIRDIETATSHGAECDKQEWMILLEKLRKVGINDE